MGVLDNIFDKDRDGEKKKADFSDVVAGGSSTAPPADVPAAARPAEPNVAEYGDASKWHRIYEANKDTIKNPDLIYPGQNFKIPDA